MDKGGWPLTSDLGMGVPETGKARIRTDSGGKRMLSLIFGHIEFQGLWDIKEGISSTTDPFKNLVFKRKS